MSAIAQKTTSTESIGQRAKRRSGFPIAYLVVLVAIVTGFYIKDQNIVNPTEGVGYWLGIVGASMMLILLLYPLRKRIKGLRFLGAIRYWFQLHMFCGLFGPLLILYHSNFSLGSINSQVAMFCMLTVAGSGIIGRHLYAHIHHGLYGRKANLLELQTELSEPQNVEGIGRLPEVAQTLEFHATQLLNELPGSKISYGRSLLWALDRPMLRSQVKRKAVQEIKQTIPDRKEAKMLKKYIKAYIDRQFDTMRRVAQFKFYERMFFLWHILHLPLFFMLILSAIAHVIAVHMY